MTKILRAGEDITAPTHSPTAPTAVSHAQHTPTPWTVGERCGQEIAINAPEGDPSLRYDTWKQLATVYGCDEQDLVGGQVMEANAAFLVRACNHHEALLAALKGLVREFEHAAVVHIPLSFNIKAIADARVAILNAEGK